MADTPQMGGQAAGRAAMGRVSPSRRAATEVLLAVGAGRGHSDDLLHGRAARGLSEPDRHLMFALVMGVLRWQIALDAEWKPLLTRPDAALQPVVEVALRLALFQLRHMERIPVHAAIDESVELVKAGGAPHAAGMVNAMLRKLATAKARGPRLVESTAEMALRLGHPAWLAERWARRYGRERAQQICEADQRVGDDAGGPVFGSALDDASGEPLRMDDGSRLVAELVAAAAPSSSTTGWDMCAAPGGKTAVLAARLPAVAWLATDVSPSRAKAMAERLALSAPTARVERLDAVAAAFEGRFDVVLCDAPCSGTGTLGRNPEIRQRLEPAELGRQARRQSELLAAALRSLRPGGRCVYSTCSLEPEENEAVVAAVLERAESLNRAGLRIRKLDLAMPMAELASVGLLAVDGGAWIADGVLRTLPGANFSGDGFYACLLERC